MILKAYSFLLSNKDMLSGILNLFKGGGLNLQNKKRIRAKYFTLVGYRYNNVSPNMGFLTSPKPYPYDFNMIISEN